MFYCYQWEITQTEILRPAQNNKRVISQAGWFTAHRYSENDNYFVPLENDNKNVIKFIIPAIEKIDILKKLNIFGINHQSLYPDIEGVGRQINWEFGDTYPQTL